MASSAPRGLRSDHVVTVGIALFSMLFGAGNLIFPVHLGQMAGRNVLPAMIGFIITAVGIPILGVAAIGVTHSDGLQTLSSKVGKGYGIFFTCLLYLTIGPFFAIPRCATTSFTVGLEQVLPQGTGYITDLGMTGPADAVLGIRPECSIQKQRFKLPTVFEVAGGDCRLCGALFDIDEATGRCRSVERLAVR